jgi:zinc transport system ATP-binding protein
VRYDREIALESVDLDIFHDDFLGVIGPNGGGKTTLVKSILGMVPYEGEIVFAKSKSPNVKPNGYLVSSGNNEIKNATGNNKITIGYLPQQNTFDRNFPISVREVVLSGLQSRKGIMKRYSSIDRELADELLETVGLNNLARKPVGAISGGEMQRALLCRAIIAEPQLLILDEPTNFVDNKFEKQLYALLQDLNRRMAILMVSHDLGTISSVVKSIVCVNRHLYRHNSNIITVEQLHNYDCPIQIISHGEVPHTVLETHR